MLFRSQDILRAHSGKRKTVIGRKTQHPANAAFFFGYQQSPLRPVIPQSLWFDVWFDVWFHDGNQYGEIVLEREHARVVKISLASCPRISRAKVASRVIGGVRYRR